MYWIIVLGFGYALGTFMAAGWRPYAMCVPVSALVFFVTDFLIASPQMDPDVPQVLYYIVGSVMYVPILMLGVFLAQRKAKKNSYD
jgi:hypothetical protein